MLAHSKPMFSHLRLLGSLLSKLCKAGGRGLITRILHHKVRLDSVGIQNDIAIRSGDLERESDRAALLTKDDAEGQVVSGVEVVSGGGVGVVCGCAAAGSNGIGIVSSPVAAGVGAEVEEDNVVGVRDGESVGAGDLGEDLGLFVSVWLL